MTPLPSRVLLRLGAALFCAAAGSAWLGAASQADDEVDFNRDIRPLLSDRCFRCHGPDADDRKADLRLDQEESARGILGGGKGGLAESELWARVSSEDGDLRMPPPDSGKALSDKELTLLRRWLERGAPWAAHWAYVAPRRTPPPAVARGDWPANWIDHFVLSRLEAEGLEPSPDADPVTLLRRVTFDLTGLPPTPAEVEAFVADPSQKAYEQVVDRLLQSPRYGERMASYWLDLVRFANTVGYHGDQDHHISPYRDWVIDAFNDNMPLDEFTTAQLAGDLLPGATIDQKIATGYNRLLQTSHEGGVQVKEYLAIYAADRVRNVSAVWLGATVGCAQCHDHKYDPFTARDFYSLAAFFADVDEAQHFKLGSNALPTRRPPELKVLTRGERLRQAELREELASLKAAKAPDQARIAEREAALKALESNARMTMVTESIEPREMRILPRGDWLDDSGPVVAPAAPAFLGVVAAEGRATRLDLARWLTDVDAGVGGLTARLFANRLWYLMFGAGLAPVLDDFGAQGAPPTHPRLLDNLALEFIARRWDMQAVLREIATSRAYRQSSVSSPPLRARDPYNRLLARQGRYRLPAEMVRDNALAVSGLLVLEQGGQSVRPYQPKGYYRHLNFPQREYQADSDARQWRRGVYVHWQRQFLHPSLKALDAPNREECTARRRRSNTPLAALALLNDPTFVEAARVLAESVLLGGDTFEQRLDFACRRAVSRPADAAERAALRALWETSRAAFAADPASAKALLQVGLTTPRPELDPIDVAAWTTVARAVLNLSETMTRN